jgi:glucuronoarabinoxylan endo-1,4-beta-xylanase
MRRLIALLVSAVAVAATTTPALAADPAATGSVSFDDSLQPIDGFGFSEFFGRSAVMHGSEGLSAQHQQEVADLLLSPTDGAGLSILRLGIASTPDTSIEPTDPGGPNATPRYTWDGDDDGQVWLAKEAASYGVTRFYADAWSAPGYMKDNGDEANGGTLCGLQGTSCASGDWRQAYANYLVQYTKYYAQEGIRITDLGFVNEPNWTATYSSMRLTPAQAAELATVVGPTAIAAGLAVDCCDAVNWSSEADYSSAIVNDPNANRWITTHTGHAYGSAPTSPLSVGDHHTWMSEWSPDGSTWNENWDDDSGYDGITVAEAIQTALTAGDVNGYVYWYGASTGATRGLIQLDGDSYHVSKRLWAMAAYSRFIRPTAVRVPASTDDSAIQISAYRNADGSRVIELLNTATATVPTTLTLDQPGTPTTYLTDTTHSLAPTNTATINGSTLTAQLPARSLTTVVLPGN